MESARLDTLVNAVPEPMLFIGQDGAVAVGNAAAEALFGDWIIGRSFAAVLRQPGVLSKIETAQATGAAGEARFHRADQAGETQYRVSITALEHDRRPFPVLLHFSDITHLREAEEMRRDFVANVSHELRTPLTAVLGFIETLRGPAKDDTKARERFLGIMEEESRRMNRLVSDLLSLSRVEGEERVRPSEDVDLRAVLSAVIAALRPTAEDNNNDIRLEVPEGEGTDADFTVKGDRDQLMQVFLNLTENALKYGGPDKPVTLTVSTEEGLGALKGRVVRVDVIDQGEGIHALHLPRLTERFYRIDTHRSRAMGGTGLGLAIVKHIINRHRGRLQISSEQGVGSTFTVLLPAN